MPDYKKFDPKLEQLVVEVRTAFDPDLSLTDDERSRLAAWVHREPATATRLHYERAHTGFTRCVQVTAGDVDRWRAGAP